MSKETIKKYVERFMGYVASGINAAIDAVFSVPRYIGTFFLTIGYAMRKAVYAITDAAQRMARLCTRHCSYDYCGHRICS